MKDGRFGIWLIGAWGSVATKSTASLVALQNDLRLTPTLMSEEPRFARLDLADWTCFQAIGGHEIRRTSFLVEAKHAFAESRAFTPELFARIAPALDAFDKNVRTGTLINVGHNVESRATTAALKTRGERSCVAINRIAADLAEFAVVHSLQHVIVVNVASADPAMALDTDRSVIGRSWLELSHDLDRADRSPVPASTLYAIAALKSGCSYINFATSVGSDLPALRELALAMGRLHMGRNGKQDKNVSPEGAVLDVVRFCEREHRRRKTGLMTHLSAFFQQPMRTELSECARQPDYLERWSAEIADEA